MFVGTCICPRLCKTTCMVQNKLSGGKSSGKSEQFIVIFQKMTPRVGFCTQVKAPVKNEVSQRQTK